MNKHYWIIVLMVFGLAAQPATAAKLYKWVDEFGNVTYRDTPPTEEVEYEEKNIGGNTVGSSEYTEEAEGNVERPAVVLYVTSSCGACNSARSYMQSRGVPFEEKNVEGSGELQQELKAKAGELSVPTILVGAKVMRGYVESLLEGELDAAGYPKAGEGEGEGAETGTAESDAGGEQAQ